RACRALRPGGRLAVVVSASWLDMKYGQELKRALLERFRIHLLLGFEGRVFQDALVKPVVLLAEKDAPSGETTFARLADAASLATLPAALSRFTGGDRLPAAAVAQVRPSDLHPDRPW